MSVTCWLQKAIDKNGGIWKGFSSAADIKDTACVRLLKANKLRLISKSRMKAFNPWLGRRNSTYVPAQSFQQFMYA